MLNAEEKSLLIPFSEITLPSYPKPLFEYANYVISVTGDLCIGVKNWHPYKGKNAVKCSLIAMFLRASKNLNHLFIDEVFCTKLIFERHVYLYENTTITSLVLILSPEVSEAFKSKAMDGLVKVLYKNSTLISLNLVSFWVGTERTKTLLEILSKNTVLKSLRLRNFLFHYEEGNMTAKLLCENATLTSLCIRGEDEFTQRYISPEIASENGKALANALCKNNTLKNLDLQFNWE
ncbi:protein NLRC3 isoform X1 [Gigaspora margarita]|uniref:Protein NLRC3 isoform X1 n=1 Tax=Gigaspora margarita TaxID=4874 RepID=A0A8H3XB76_GIGMA|nr:protein NLRC3 isoform X1 [Gigaspora margarita]